MGGRSRINGLETPVLFRQARGEGVGELLVALLSCLLFLTRLLPQFPPPLPPHDQQHVSLLQCCLGGVVTLTSSFLVDTLQSEISRDFFLFLALRIV